MVYSWLKNTQYMLFPGHCVLCGELTGRHSDLCCDCEKTLSKSWPRCQQCALPCTINVLQCGQCAQQGYQFSRCETLALYQPPIDALISALKYQRRLAPGMMLAELLCAQIRQRYQGDQWPTYITPVPMHWRRQWRRGFNQAHLLATMVGKRLQTQVLSDLLERHQATPSQQGLNQQQRQHNVKRAFRLRRPPPSSHIVLMDDVVTTGATCNQLAKLLLNNGAKRVDVWCLARTDSKALRTRR